MGESTNLMREAIESFPVKDYDSSLTYINPLAGVREKNWFRPVSEGGYLPDVSAVQMLHESDNLAEDLAFLTVAAIDNFMEIERPAGWHDALALGALEDIVSSFGKAVLGERLAKQYIQENGYELVDVSDEEDFAGADMKTTDETVWQVKVSDKKRLYDWYQQGVMSKCDRLLFVRHVGDGELLEPEDVTEEILDKYGN